MLGLILLSTIPTDYGTINIFTETVELNHFHDGDGKHVFTQVIWWDADGCRDWRMVAKCGPPCRNWETGSYETTWIEDGKILRVRSAFFRETWTQVDPELEASEWLPPCARRRIP